MLDAAGAAFCVGGNYYGQLGVDPSLTPGNSSDTPVAVPGGHLFAALAIGNDFTVAVLPNKSLLSWVDADTQDTICYGSCSEGECGSGDPTNTSDSVAGTRVVGGLSFQALSAGSQFTCGLTATGDAYCWGYNALDQLGNSSSRTQSFTPLLVQGGHKFEQISSGQEHSCAIAREPTNSTSTWCWGDNYGGALGYGSTASVNVPVRVVGDHQFSSVAAGYRLTAGIEQGTSRAFIWGEETNELKSENLPTPTLIDNSSYLALDAGVFEMYGLLQTATTPAAPAPTAANQPSAQADGGSSSSVPVGAIAGGVAGGMVGVAVLAFLALRPGKGWLRKRQAPHRTGAPTDGQLESGKLLSSTEAAGSKLTPSASPHLTPGASTGKQLSLDTDPVLTVIASNLDSHLAASRAAEPSPKLDGGSSGELQQWHVNWDDLRVERLLGRGSFGRVYLARWDETPVAVKVLLTPDMVEQGELQLPPGVLRDLQEALDAASGLLYLHRRSPPIIHRDIKSPNLLLDDNWRVKVADFNLSKILAEQPAGTQTSTRGATNPIWLAPEILRGGRASAAADVYAFGLVLWELLTWRLPWLEGQPMQPFKIARTVVSGIRPAVPPANELPGPGASNFASLDEYCSIMRACWAQDPGERPTFSDVAPRLRALLDALPE
ncbi:hypothetical protein COHA_001545 [Chlorella ohadii]|uniref:Protein kinase domain-containing protein n=1 Tax=Chlorella ohadii TaxID=2649997 RepID=A0AAD5H5T1_9CHLO|nr:hypothetical protein COHA_001545 [Chlorella ohadii]